VKELINIAYNETLLGELRIFFESALVADESTDDAMGLLKRRIVKLKWAAKVLEDELCD
jgi:hypothetical protein